MHELHQRHERRFEANRFVYPVLSRRSGGLSVGINLNPDKTCNFDCVYCQVDRVEPGEDRFVETEQLFEELDGLLDEVTSGRIFRRPPFDAVPDSQRRLNDLAFSGDGEPTSYKNLDQIIARCRAIQASHRLEEIPIVLITNASLFDRPHVVRALEELDRHPSEIWAKLDAGSDAYFQKIARTPIAFAHIMKNLIAVARVRPITLQSLFLRFDGVSPATDEIEAYCNRIGEILSAGGSIRAVQIYTVARKPAEPTVGPLGPDEVVRLAERVQRRTGIPAVPYV